MNVFWPNFKRTVDGIEKLALVVVQNHKTREVLMVAFTDEAGYVQTLQSGKVSLFSTSRKQSWIKGETSGNFMRVKTVQLDCDGDAILYLVEPQGDGVACHTQARSCFYRTANPPANIMDAPQAGPHEALEVREL